MDFFTETIRSLSEKGEKTSFGTQELSLKMRFGTMHHQLLDGRVLLRDPYFLRVPLYLCISTFKTPERSNNLMIYEFLTLKEW
jgi:hypothetical protein